MTAFESQGSMVASNGVSKEPSRNVLQIVHMMVRLTCPALVDRSVAVQPPSSTHTEIQLTVLL